MSADETDRTLLAVEAAIEDGRVLHVRSDRLPAKRRPRRDAMPPVDFTIGPDARGGFLLVDYNKKPGGVEDRHLTARSVTRAARKLLGWDRLAAARSAIRAIYGEPERATPLVIEDARAVATGAAMRRAYGHRKAIVGPIFGPSGHGSR